MTQLIPARVRPFGLLGLLLLSASWADEKPVPVSKVTESVSGTRAVRGVVSLIDEGKMTVVELRDGEEPREHSLQAVDRLKRGEVLDNVLPQHSYRWQDVKLGDGVEVEVLTEKGSGLTYCLELCIKRRPQSTLPAGQLEKQDTRYPYDRLYNEIENGHDVSDQDVMKLFPPEPERKDRTGHITPAHPGGLPRDWQAKLDAIRAKKKEAELKAPPPEKKDR